jgi:cytochrome b subunit of formate dehydrogenase
MRNLIAIPVIILAVILQSSIVSRVTFLSGMADLPLVMLAAWALQDEVETAWHWAVATGVFVGFVSGISWVVPMLSYLFVIALAQVLQRRIWQAPLLAMFSITFLGTIGSSVISLVVLQLSGISLPIADVFGLLTLPGILLNMLLAIPTFAVMRDVARWVYPAPEVE